MPHLSTSIIYTLNLKEHEVFKTLSDQVARAFHTFGAARYQAGNDDKLYDEIVQADSKPDQMCIDPALKEALQAVKACSYQTEEMGRNKYTVVLQPGHVALGVSYGLSANLMDIEDMGHKLLKALKCDKAGRFDIPEGMLGNNRDEAVVRTLAQVFTLQARDCDYGEAFSCFESIVVNKGRYHSTRKKSNPITILYEGAGATTFAKGGADRLSV
ncbi:MAG: hypothetical protein ACLFR0_02330 [Alphaproteobacteria bacterium]